jgi:8-oxo-dGTP pyrophosphatase MutT (NUDIX family)
MKDHLGLFLKENDMNNIGDFYKITKIELNFDTKKNIIESLGKLEKRHWFYLDNIVKRYPNKFKYVKFKEFVRNIIKNNASAEDYEKYNKYISIYSRWQKSRKTAGVIIFSMNYYYLVRNVGSRYFTFPKGKQEKNEPLIDTAIRETDEETGFKIGFYIPNLNSITIAKTRYYFAYLPYMMNPPPYFTSNEIESAGWFHKDYIKNNRHLFSKNVNRYIK